MKKFGLSLFTGSLLLIPLKSQAFNINIDNSVTQSPPTLSDQPSVQKIDSTIEIKKIEVLGSTVFQNSDFDPIVKPLEGHIVKSEDINKAVNQIIQLYLDGGYLNSRAVLESIEAGVVRIKILEGKIGEIIIEGAPRLKSYVLSKIELGIKEPFNQKALEDQLRLLKVDPLIEDIDASLRAPKSNTGTTAVNQSILIVHVKEAKSFVGNVGIDNYSVPSVGPTRFNLNLAYKNVTGIGDTVSALYQPSLETITGTYNLNLAYQVPVNPMNGTLTTSINIENNKIIGEPFSDLNISGESQKYSLIYRQPIIRTPVEELALSVGFDYYHGQTFLLSSPTPFGIGPAPNGVSQTTVFSLIQDYTLRDPKGTWFFSSQFRIGICALGATCNPAPIPSGDFFSWLAQIQRVQILNKDQTLITQFDAQLTPDPLLPSETFAIGGAQSVRGYRQNLLAGDNGLRFSIEDRITLVKDINEKPVFQIAPFFDMGTVWNVPNNPNIIVSDQTFIAGLGLAFIWQPIPNLFLRLDYAPPLVNTNLRGNNIQDDGLYFSVGYNF